MRLRIQALARELGLMLIGFESAGRGIPLMWSAVIGVAVFLDLTIVLIN